MTCKQCAGLEERLEHFRKASQARTSAVAKVAVICLLAAIGLLIAIASAVFTWYRTKNDGLVLAGFSGAVALYVSIGAIVVLVRKKELG